MVKIIMFIMVTKPGILSPNWSQYQTKISLRIDVFNINWTTVKRIYFMIKVAIFLNILQSQE